MGMHALVASNDAVQPTLPRAASGHTLGRRIALFTTALLLTSRLLAGAPDTLETKPGPSRADPIVRMLRPDPSRPGRESPMLQADPAVRTLLPDTTARTLPTNPPASTVRTLLPGTSNPSVRSLSVDKKAFIPFQKIEVLIFDEIPNRPGTATPFHEISNLVVRGPLEFECSEYCDSSIYDYGFQPVKQVVAEGHLIHIFYEDGRDDIRPPYTDIRIKDSEYILQFAQFVQMGGPGQLLLDIYNIRRSGPYRLCFEMNYNRGGGFFDPEKKKHIALYGGSQVFGPIRELIEKGKLPPSTTKRLIIPNGEFEGLTFQAKREFSGWRYALPIPKKGE